MGLDKFAFQPGHKIAIEPLAGVPVRKMTVMPSDGCSEPWTQSRAKLSHRVSGAGGGVINAGPRAQTVGITFDFVESAAEHLFLESVGCLAQVMPATDSVAKVAASKGISGFCCHVSDFTQVSLERLPMFSAVRVSVGEKSHGWIRQVVMHSETGPRPVAQERPQRLHRRRKPLICNTLQSPII